MYPICFVFYAKVMANTLTASNLQTSLKRGGGRGGELNRFNDIHGFLMIFIFLLFFPCPPTQILNWNVQETGNQFGLASCNS